jgi:phosphoribosylformylglycinamidine synthase
MAIVLTAPGTNRHDDVEFALRTAGANTRVVPLDEALTAPDTLRGAHIVVVAGGFSFDDQLGAGRLWSLELMRTVGDHLRQLVAAGTLMLGIGNGFQMLTHAGLLPGSLGVNQHGHFRCEWVQLEAPATRCLWTQGLGLIECPIANGEGRYTHPDPESLADNGQVALRYRGANSSGSVANIAGVCDPTGRVLGLMPHPENHVVPRQHPQHRMPHHIEGSRLGLMIFERGVNHVTKTQL